MVVTRLVDSAISVKGLLLSGHDRSLAQMCGVEGPFACRRVCRWKY
jgi:hypothetical protein